MRRGAAPPAPRGSGVRRLALAGALLGALFALPVFAPAAWLAAAVASATGDRVLLADAQGTVWSGSAVPVLTGGEGSRDASALPGRVSWTLRPEGLALGIALRQACCITGELRLKVEPRIGGVRITLPAAPGRLGQWPAAWLAGLGTPFNTLQIGGTMSLTSGGLVAQSAAGRWRVDGQAALEIDDLASRLSTISPLGSYRVALTGGDAAQVALSTTTGALQLNGSGQFSGRGLRFRGDARAAPGSEAALDNLLNLLGRRQGTLALLAIG